MIEVEGMINNRPLIILIDLGASYSYVDPRVVESLHLSRSKHEKSWLVQLAIGTKRKVTELVKSCSVDMKGLSIKAELNILPLGSYDCLIGMDWLDQHHALLDYRNKRFTCLDEEGNRKTVQGIPRVVTVREISAMQLKKCYRKGCQLFAARVEEASRDAVSNIGDHEVLTEFKDVFQEVLGLPPKRDIDFSINLMPAAAPVSKAPYRMSTPDLKEHERNYATHDLELAAIIHALRKWRHYLMGRRFELKIEHNGLKYLFDQPTLKARKTRWLEFLCEYEFDIKHIKGKENKVADGLNRKVHDLHATSISMYRNDIRDRVLEAANVDLQFRDLVAKLQ
jgi:hypothetical protein